MLTTHSSHIQSMCSWREVGRYIMHIYIGSFVTFHHKKLWWQKPHATTQLQQGKHFMIHWQQHWQQWNCQHGALPHYSSSDMFFHHPPFLRVCNGIVCPILSSLSVRCVLRRGGGCDRGLPKMRERGYIATAMVLECLHRIGACFVFYHHWLAIWCCDVITGRSLTQWKIYQSTLK